MDGLPYPSQHSFCYLSSLSFYVVSALVAAGMSPYVADEVRLLIVLMKRCHCKKDNTILKENYIYLFNI